MLVGGGAGAGHVGEGFPGSRWRRAPQGRRPPRPLPVGACGASGCQGWVVDANSWKVWGVPPLKGHSVAGRPKGAPCPYLSDLSIG